MKKDLSRQTLWWLIAILVFSFNSFATAQNVREASNSAKSRWSTPWAERVGAQLEYTANSSGPDAWDAEQHPTVFITTEGPGYGGLMSGVTLPGVAIYDADTREVVAQQTYDVLSWGWKNVFEPHGLGTSPDGKWIYLATGEGAILTTGEHAGRFIVINAQTLKVEKVIKLRGQAHHASSYVTPEGEQRVMLYGWSQPLLVVDPDDDHRVVGSMTEQEQGSEAYLYFASPDGSQIMGTGRYRSFDMRKHLDDNPLLIIDTSSWTIKKWVHGNDSAPVWIAYSSDNKYAYVSGAKHSIVMKLDLDEEKVVTEQRAGVDGPYGIHLGWDDQFIYTVGKGEESHNRGKMLGMVDAYTMEAPNSRAMDQFYTGCIRGDHGTLHPDPEANELWVTCNASFEIAIFDLDLRQVTARLPTPNGGSTHSGAFVTYPNGWDGPGETVSDHNGLQGSALEIKRKIIAGQYTGEPGATYEQDM